eukprot:17767-Rhodomonas_salina.2
MKETQDQQRTNERAWTPRETRQPSPISTPAHEKRTQVGIVPTPLNHPPRAKPTALASRLLPQSTPEAAHGKVAGGKEARREGEGGEGGGRVSEEGREGARGAYSAHGDLEEHRDVLSLIVGDGVGGEGGDLGARDSDAGARERGGEGREGRVGALGRLRLEGAVDPRGLEVEAAIERRDVLVEEKKRRSASRNHHRVVPVLEVVVQAEQPVLAQDRAGAVGERRDDDSRALVAVEEAELRAVEGAQVAVAGPSVVARSQIAVLPKRSLQPQDAAHQVAVAQRVNTIASKHGHTLDIRGTAVVPPLAVLAHAHDRLRFGPVRE